MFEDGCLRVCDQKNEGQRVMVKKQVMKYLELTTNKGFVQEKYIEGLSAKVQDTDHISN